MKAYLAVLFQKLVLKLKLKTEKYIGFSSFNISGKTICQDSAVQDQTKFFLSW